MSDFMKLLFLTPRAGNKANTLPLSWYQANWYSDFYNHNPRWSFIYSRASQTETSIIFLKHCSRFGGQWSEVIGDGTNGFEGVSDNVNMWSLYSLNLQSIWGDRTLKHLAADAKLFQSCSTLWDPIDSSPPGSAIPGILQARTLEWVAISFSNYESEKWKWSRLVVSDSSWPLDCSLPGSSIHGIFQARVLEWGANAFLRA